MSALPTASVVIRAYNEGHHLGEVMRRLAAQSLAHEVIVVDSGSTDETAKIAERHGARVLRIAKHDFTFGRSLNVGVSAAAGDVVVALSGHCYPMHRRWLAEMVSPFINERVACSYGMQRGGRTTKFSEHSHFHQTFPDESRKPQADFFCNNANCAIRRSLWQSHHYDESLTGLEDLEWAKWAVEQGHLVAYRSSAGVIHLHDETWPQVFRRYEREAIALRQILPDFSFGVGDLTRAFFRNCYFDLRRASRRQRLFSTAREIGMFRAMQFWGTYCGANYEKPITRQTKERFFYPK